MLASLKKGLTYCAALCVFLAGVSICSPQPSAKQKDLRCYGYNEGFVCEAREKAEKGKHDWTDDYDIY